MPRLSPARTLILAIAALLSPAPLSAGDGWQTYANPRFGTHAEYPAKIFSRREPPPENGDGQTFTDKDGTAKLSIYGSLNSGDYRPRAYVDELIRPRDAIAYERIAKNFFAVSGRRGETIWYQRCIFEGGGSGTIHCFVLEYPARQKQQWDPTVARIAASLRAGRVHHSR
jgi:hypothetical protein